jgi:hypothetical protein
MFVKPSNSVQQQNLDTRTQILRVAREFKRDPARFSGVVHTLHAHSLDATKGILVEHESIPDQGGWVHKGRWLTRQREFFRFEVLVPYDRGEPPVVEMWQEVTHETAINAHQPGTGKSFGWLAVDVMENELGRGA